MSLTKYQASRIASNISQATRAKYGEGWQYMSDDARKNALMAGVVYSIATQGAEKYAAAVEAIDAIREHLKI